MRRETSGIQHECQACYGAGTRVEVHRSRYELERVLNKYGAHDVLFVEADANASIQFAMQGRYVQLAMPLPDPENARFTHTPSGRRRTIAAQERAYEQALRQHWRSLVVAVRGKLQSVESGISTFEHEFEKFLVPHFAEDKKRNRKTPKAVHWLLGGSNSLAIGLVAAFLVPASAVGAFALPTNVVGHLAAPFQSAVRDAAGSGADDGLALARGGWSPSRGGSSGSSDAARLSALRQRSGNLLSAGETELRVSASLANPPVDDSAAPPAAPSSDVGAPQTGGGTPPAAPSGPAQRPPSGGNDAPVPPTTSDNSISLPDDDVAAASSDSPDVEQPNTDVDASDPVGDTGDSATTPDTGGDTPADDPGNGKGNGQDNGNGNGQGNGDGNGQGNGQGQGQGNGQGNKGNAKGHR